MYYKIAHKKCSFMRCLKNLLTLIAELGWVVWTPQGSHIYIEICARLYLWWLYIMMSRISSTLHKKLWQALSWRTVGSRVRELFPPQDTELHARKSYFHWQSDSRTKCQRNSDIERGKEREVGEGRVLAICLGKIFFMSWAKVSVSNKCWRAGQSP